MLAKADVPSFALCIQELAGITATVCTFASKETRSLDVQARSLDVEALVFSALTVDIIILAVFDLS